VKVSTQFSKGSDAQYSNQVYTVSNIHGSKIELSNGKSYPDADVLKVLSNSVTITKPNPIEHAKKEYKQTRVLKKEEIKPDNVVREKRIVKPRQILDI
jgi:hypothetical protein